MTHMPLSFWGSVLCIDYTNADSILNPSRSYRQQPCFAYEWDTYLDIVSLHIFHFDSLLADVKVPPQNTSGRATSGWETRRGKSYRGSVHAFFKWGPLRVCTHKLFLKILLAYCLRWVLETITSACISPRISITPSFSPGACFCARPLWRVDNACHLPESTQLPANKPAGVTSASPPLISIHTPAY